MICCANLHTIKLTISLDDQIVTLAVCQRYRNTITILGKSRDSNRKSDIPLLLAIFLLSQEHRRFIFDVEHVGLPL